MLIRNLVFLLFMMSFCTSYGQEGSNSPYSRFGLGDINDKNFNHLRHMGGISASYIDAFHINTMNPASYAFLNNTAFDIGVFAKNTTLLDSEKSINFWTGNIEYLALAFPLTNPINDIYDGVKRNSKFGMAFSLAPYSEVSYNIATKDSSNIGNFIRNYKGQGGTYKLNGGLAYKYKNFSTGLNLGFLFGNTRYENNIGFEPSAFAYGDFYSTNYSTRGFIWNSGLLYELTLNKKEVEKNKQLPLKRLSLGLHGNLPHLFSTESSVRHFAIQNLSNSVSIVDTLRIEDGIKGKGKLPAELGLGATFYSGEKYALGVNYVGALWKSFYNDAAQSNATEMSNSSRFSIGGYFRPDFRAFDNYFKRFFYRFGVFYANDPRIINGQNVNSYGATMGLGLPFVYQRKISFVNVGIEGGRRGDLLPVSENYVKFSLGVTFNDDEWFLKRKYY